jgi:hypothetical protein
MGFGDTEPDSYSSGDWSICNAWVNVGVDGTQSGSTHADTVRA